MNLLIGVGIALQCNATSTINPIHASGHHIDKNNVSTTCAWANCPLMPMYGPLARLIPNIDTILRENIISFLQTERMTPVPSLQVAVKPTPFGLNITFVQSKLYT